MHIWGKGPAAGRVRLFVGNRGSGQRFAGSGRVQEKWPVDNSVPDMLLGGRQSTCCLIKNERASMENGCKDYDDWQSMINTLIIKDSRQFIFWRNN